MKRLVKYPLTDEKGAGFVYVEVDAVEPSGGAERASRVGDKFIEAAQSFTATLDQIKPAISVVLSTLGDAAEGVTQIDLQFGIKLNGQAGVPAFASVAGEAQYTVSVKWQPVRQASS
jgi:hypothetical protein